MMSFAQFALQFSGSGVAEKVAYYYVEMPVKQQHLQRAMQKSRPNTGPALQSLNQQ